MIRALAILALASSLLSACEDSEARARLDRMDKQVQDTGERIEALERELSSLRVALGTVEEDATNEALRARLDAVDRQLGQLGRTPTPGGPSPAAGAGRPDPAEVYAVAVDGHAAIGPRDALVTIVKAYEYACPYCERVRNTMAGLRARYGSEVRIVYRHFIVHPQTATIPAQAACAAHRQGKFAELDELIWEKGYKANRNLGQDNMEALAREVGLDLTQFRRDLQGVCVGVVAADQRELKSVGIRGTPGFFVNGRHLSGAQPQAAFEAVIDEELARARQRINAGTRAADYYRTWVLERGKTSL